MKFNRLHSSMISSKEVKIEGELLISWEYTPPKYKKTIRSLLPSLLIIAWIAFSFFFNKWTKHLGSAWTVLMMFLVGVAMKKFKSQKYQLTTRGVFVFDQNKKRWNKLGYWEEFIDYERSENRIKLRKRELFGEKNLYFNKNFENFFKVIETINENIFKHKTI